MLVSPVSKVPLLVVAGIFAVLVGLAVPRCWAQSQSATLIGTISDPTKAVVSGVKVSIVNVDTGETWSAVSNDSGGYVIPLVKPGRYTLTAEISGFKQHNQTGVVLETGVPTRVDFVLEVGAVTESISVEASVPLLRTETSSVGAVIDNRTIVNMPLMNRRAAQLARLTGFLVQNVQIGPQLNFFTTGSNFAMAGGRGDNAGWLIDGGSVQNITLGIPMLMFDPPVESLQEFNVSISNYAAELGRTGGGVVQMTTKSGTNEFHGSVYEYLRNDALDARTFFAATKSKQRYNLFGASIGGPIMRAKTHFFFNYEGLIQRQATTRVLNVPTPAETQGDFSGSPFTVRDPQADGSPPFLNNVIPSSRQDPVGANLAAFYPLPNVPGRPSGSSNFLANQPLKNSNNFYVARVDHVFTDRDRAYGRFLAATAQPEEFNVYPEPAADPFLLYRKDAFFNVSGTWFHNLGSTTVNEFRFTWDRRTFRIRSGGTDSGLAEEIGIKGTNLRLFPLVTLTGLSGFGSGLQERIQVPIRNNAIQNYVTHIRGNHGIKFGYEYRYASNIDTYLGTGGGAFAFNNTATGSSLAALLLGWVQSGSRVETLPLRSRANTMGAFLQDDWKVTPRLTLNLGLRWDKDQPRWEQFDNRQSSFDRFAINPVSSTPGVVTFSGRNGLSKFAHNSDWNNFGPRIGFAWRATDNWVIRGGGAIVYVGQYDQVATIVASLGFSLKGDFVSPDNGLTPAFLLRDGLPPIKEPTEADLTPGFGAVSVGQKPINAVDFFEPNGRRSGYMETINFSVQRQLTASTMVEIGYLGTLAHKLPAPNDLTINQVRPELMGPGNAQIRRPFPQFSDVVVLSPAIGNSNYHGLNFKVEKRYSRGLHFQANYTWSKFIDDVAARAELGGNLTNAYSNIYDRSADRGLAGNHISHRFIWSSTYELPFGSGDTLHPAWKQILGGWSVGLVAELRTGSPYGVQEQVNRTNAFSPAQRPNVVGDPEITLERSRGEKVEQWFDTSAFAPPPEFTFGNAGRTVGYGPGAIVTDLSILKDFPLNERHRLQFRTEVMNFINNPNFASPNVLRGNPAFGRITSLIGGNQSRTFQFGLHYKF